MFSPWTLILCLLAAMPLPQEAREAGRRGFLLRPDTPVVVAPQHIARAARWVAPLEAELGWKLSIVPFDGEKHKGPAIYVLSEGELAPVRKRWNRTALSHLEQMHPEGYVLSSESAQVLIAGKRDGGGLYGLQMLTGLVAQYGVQLPPLAIRDWPDVDVRGRHVRGLLTTDQLAQLAGERVNQVIVESTDFLRFDPDRAAHWQRFFEDARSYAIDPIPLIPFFHDAGPLLDSLPEAGEGRHVEEAIRLSGDDWASLSQRNLIVSGESPVMVRISGVLCRENEDYMLEGQPLQGPRQSLIRPWMIRRVPGGRIPDGATVSVQYSWLPSGSQSVCPHSLVFQEAFKEDLAQWTAQLKPTAIHVGLENIARVGEDYRCLRHSLSREFPTGAVLEVLSDLLSEVDGDLKLMAWTQAGDRVATAPASVRLAAITRNSKAAPDSNLVRYDGLPSRSWPLLNALAAREGAAGVYVSGLPESGTGGLTVLGLAWNLDGISDPWVRGLNEAFDAALQGPDHEERIDALVGFLNRQVLGGVDPDVLRAYGESAFTGLLSPAGVVDAPELEQTRRLYQNLTDYLAAEYAYHQRPGEAQLRPFISVIEGQAALDPALDAERLARIVGAVREQGLFPPASIVFRRPLRYYRPVAGWQDAVPLRMPQTPQYSNTAGTATALLDLGGPVGPLFRIDCETVQAESIEVLGGGSFNEMHRLAELQSTAGPARGPVMFSSPQSVSKIQMTVRSSAESTVLREIDVFALKFPAVVQGPMLRRIATAGAPSAQFDWAAEPNAVGFVDTKSGALAESPAWAWIARDRDALRVRVEIHEPRPHATVANYREQDSPLWLQEALELRVRAANQQVYRFIANPLGTRFDSRAEDAAWDGNWRAVSENRTTGWTVLFEIPFGVLGIDVQLERSLELNLIRYRHNVTQDESAWAVENFAAGTSPGWGRVDF